MKYMITTLVILSLVFINATPNKETVIVTKPATPISIICYQGQDYQNFIIKYSKQGYIVQHIENNNAFYSMAVIMVKY